MNTKENQTDMYMYKCMNLIISTKFIDSKCWEITTLLDIVLVPIKPFNLWP